MSHHNEYYGGQSGPGYSPYGQQYPQGLPPQMGHQGPPVVVQEQHQREPHHGEQHHHGKMHNIAHPSHHHNDHHDDNHCHK